jgi:uncharacterized membrane protein YhaH (DUF805 family)
VGTAVLVLAVALAIRRLRDIEIAGEST